jgi:hypothetical protein
VDPQRKCFSLMEGDREIGLARVITDCVTYAYLCAVDIEKGRRGQGLGVGAEAFQQIAHVGEREIPVRLVAGGDREDYVMGLGLR